MKVLDIATNFLGGLSVTDTQSGFRAYGKRAIDCICIDDDGMSAGSEILLQAKDNRLKVEEVEIHCSYNVERASTENPVSHGVKVLLILLQDMELRRPLFYFTLPVNGAGGSWDRHRSGVALDLLSRRAALATG